MKVPTYGLNMNVCTNESTSTALTFVYRTPTSKNRKGPSDYISLLPKKSLQIEMKKIRPLFHTISYMYLGLSLGLHKDIWLWCIPEDRVSLDV